MGQAGRQAGDSFCQNYPGKNIGRHLVLTRSIAAVYASTPLEVVSTKRAPPSTLRLRLVHQFDPASAAINRLPVCVAVGAVAQREGMEFRQHSGPRGTRNRLTTRQHTASRHAHGFALTARTRALVDDRKSTKKATLSSRAWGLASSSRCASVPSKAGSRPTLNSWHTVRVGTASSTGTWGVVRKGVCVCACVCVRAQSQTITINNYHPAHFCTRSRHSPDASLRTRSASQVRSSLRPTMSRM